MSLNDITYATSFIMNNPIFSFGNSFDVVFVSKTTGKMSLFELEFPKLISTLLYVSTGSSICLFCIVSGKKSSAIKVNFGSISFIKKNKKEHSLLFCF